MGLIIGRGNLGFLHLLLLFIERDNHQEVSGTDPTARRMVVHRETEKNRKADVVGNYLNMLFVKHTDNFEVLVVNSWSLVI